ncbi:MAG: HAD family phosphatase [Erysipelothrix sp.]|nr:HAD family phosphatase [Erysipelothrix sp.]
MIVCSDYDRTFKVNQQISEENLQAVRRLRKLGHLFVINTGRTFQSFKEEYLKYSFEFDYAICGSGSQIINQSFQLIHQTTFSKETVKMIIDDLVQSSATIIQYSNQDQWIVHRNTLENSFDQKLYQKLPNHINTFSCRFHTMEEAKQFFDMHSFQINAFLNYYSIDMVAPKIDKATGLHQLVKQLDIDLSQVYVIGDGLNDLPMLLQFNGAVVQHGQDGVKKEIDKIVIDVASYIDQLLNPELEKPVN